jgi:hypothetical protein
MPEQAHPARARDALQRLSEWLCDDRGRDVYAAATQHLSSEQMTALLARSAIRGHLTDDGSRWQSSLWLTWHSWQWPSLA